MPGRLFLPTADAHAEIARRKILPLVVSLGTKSQPSSKPFGWTDAMFFAGLVVLGVPTAMLAVALFTGAVPGKAGLPVLIALVVLLFLLLKTT